MQNVRWCELVKVVQVIEEKEINLKHFEFWKIRVSCEGHASSQIPPVRFLKA